MLDEQTTQIVAAHVAGRDDEPAHARILERGPLGRFAPNALVTGDQDQAEAGNDRDPDAIGRLAWYVRKSRVAGVDNVRQPCQRQRVLVDEETCERHPSAQRQVGLVPAGCLDLMGGQPISVRDILRGVSRVEELGEHPGAYAVDRR